MAKSLQEKNKRIAVLENINEELNNINAELKVDKMCLKCNSGFASYCEDCFQELIGTNAKLQYKLDSIKKIIENNSVIEAHNRIIRILEKK
jgi:hypothetical protein